MRENLRSTYIPTLDGWRGIAILLVIVGHMQCGLLGYAYHGWAWLLIGEHGVTIFFVLSGYLITTLFLREEKIDLKRFYLRRFFRLMPCAWLYLITVASIGLILRVHIIGDDAWACLLFLRNYLPLGGENSTNALTNHFWSLSLEEQFYLSWPVLLSVLGRRRALVLAITGIVACATFRYFNWQSYVNTSQATHSEVRMDALLVGCVLALLLQSERTRVWIRRHSIWIFSIGFPVAVWCVYRYQTLIPVTESLSYAAMIAATSLNPSMLASRILEWKHLKFLGVISYSVYVWQQLFLFPHTGFLGISFLPAAALGSWVLIERPCMKLGHRLTAPKQSVFVGTA